MLRKIAIALAAGALASTGAAAQDTAKIGLVLPLTGGLAPVGKQVQAGAKHEDDEQRQQRAPHRLHHRRLAERVVAVLVDGHPLQ